MDGEVVIGINMDTKGFDIQIATVEEELEGLIEEYKVLKESKPFEGQQKGLQELQKKIEQTRNKLVDLKKKQQDLDNAGLSKIPASLNGIGNGIESVIKKVTRWGLAVFGIRSAYNFVRGSISTLSQYNEKMATDIEYIRFALATTLQPVIEKIIQLVYTLLQYIGYIAKAWFGVNLFANASTKAFKRTNKEAKKLQKTLAGFDEMNVLADNSGGDSGGGAAPSMDLSNFEKVKIPDWIKWIADNKETVLQFFLELGLLIGAIKLTEFLAGLGLSASLIGGIVAVVGGLIIFIKGIIDYLKNPTWENFSKILAGIAVIAAGVFLIFGGFPALIAAIVGAVIALGVAIYKNWDDIQKTLSTVAKWINDNIIKPIANLFSGLWNGIVNGVKWAVNNIRAFFSSIPSFFGGIVNRITSLFRNIGAAAGNVIGSAFKSVINAILRKIESVLNTPIRTINNLVNTINKYTPFHLGKLNTFSLPRLAKGGIVNMPGRGVNYGGANIAEKAPEAVIPFTDEQVMDRLGQSIARHMVINATINNTMNGRVISREIQRVQNNSNFAMNR